MRETVPMADIVNIVLVEAIGVSNRARMLATHPTFDTRKDILDSANKVSGQFNLLLRLNEYMEIYLESGTNLRTVINEMRTAVEKLYAKKTS